MNIHKHEKKIFVTFTNMHQVCWSKRLHSEHESFYEATRSAGPTTDTEALESCARQRKIKEHCHTHCTSIHPGPEVYHNSTRQQTNAVGGLLEPSEKLLRGAKRSVHGAFLRLLELAVGGGSHVTPELEEDVLDGVVPLPVSQHLKPSRQHAALHATAVSLTTLARCAAASI